MAGGARREEQDDERGGLLRELFERDDLGRGGLRAFGAIGRGDHRGERVALFGPYHNEAPRGDLAMIGRARGDFQDLVELRCIGAGRDQIARAARAAGGEERERAGAVVEHGCAIAATLAYLHTRDWR
ncbi:hypothetical protein D9M73_79580 [compost metagenome]